MNGRTAAKTILKATLVLGKPRHGEKVHYPWFPFVLLASISLLLNACASPAYRMTTHQDQSPPAQTRLYYYPNKGQTPTQQERDRYECHLWAVKQTGFDPSKTPLAPHQQVEVVPEASPGANTAAGAVSGAIIGSALEGPRQTGKGLVFGAMTGAMIGAAADEAQQQQAKAIEKQYNAAYDRQYANAEREASNYRRAMTACLVGRGYTVQ